ncbi:MAG: hypothetical protein WAL56_06990 [Candidatus Sulfotelmatobacter sp.]
MRGGTVDVAGAVPGEVAKGATLFGAEVVKYAIRECSVGLFGQLVNQTASIGRREAVFGAIEISILIDG